MFDPVYGLNISLNAGHKKRNFQEDNPPYLTSFKKSRMWDDNSVQNNVNVKLADMHLFQNESHLRVIDKSEYFPAVYDDMNTFENNLMETNKLKYMPDLNAAQNPHYYEYNKLLFELYLERVKRSKSHVVYNTSSQHPF